MSILLLALIPFLAGRLFLKKTGVIVDGGAGGILFRWISGQFLLWAVFQLICVPMILLEIDFFYLLVVYSVFLGAVTVTAGYDLLRNRKRAFAVSLIRGFDRGRDIAYFGAWILFWGLLLFQLVQAVRMTYADGDDAYYVAVSSITQNSYTMYRKVPYTGEDTMLDIRHGLAPLPVWIAYMAEASGIRAVSMAHLALPLMLIPMTYSIFYLLGKTLLQKKRENLPLFLIFTELLVIFGDYSFYTVENFMIARSRQGKAALGSIVIPMIFLLLILLFHKLDAGEKVPGGLYVLLTSAAVTACLCSTLGAMLICMLMGIAGLCAAVCYRRRRLLIPMALCCAPCVGFAFLYLVLG